MTNDLTVTVALPPRGREEATLRVAAEHHPSVLRIVAAVPAPNFHEPHPLDRFLLRRGRALERLADVARLACGFVGPETRVECELIRGSLSSLAGRRTDPHDVLLVPARESSDPAVWKSSRSTGLERLAPPPRPMVAAG
ncbi:hypothetical protein [Aeromicrobium terrae]|uniref:Uncharacterized protein n=1 Tax=Aeromicrobium terrae TaxID=2498846 RepID=A0A5C8NFC4_9ACTN|nr:hypothetical protein [Aeromicrobium terrae]TXL57499.1 hypothetical protein FHP06_14085 [Aeromicrobium terrae]